MPDFTMCDGGACPRRADCKRFVSQPGSWQSYFIKPPYDGDTCELFMVASHEVSQAPSKARAYTDVKVPVGANIDEEC